MCGIAGFSGDFAPGLLGRMASVMAHRGPDGEGVWHDAAADIGLAHRRLAIIDLSETGRQPMADDKGWARAVITYNGEIYNYRELREELLRQGWTFCGGSDTEVLLNLYLRDGPEMLARLNGIFAFAIWDRQTRELFVARDGMGVKPLYYTEIPKGFLFASEIKALLQDESVSRDLNPAAVARHLTYLWSPAPETVLKHVHKLAPGMAMIIRAGRIVRRWRHYDPPTGRVRKGTPSPHEAAAKLRGHLHRAVERQMVADVPVGAFLSGGLDSSAVVASARRCTGQRLRCFTIDFEDKGASDYEGMAADLPYAQKVARHLDVDLDIVTVGPEMVDHLAQMIYHLDEPQADPAPLNVLFIAALARAHGIKVLLSGAGGDDIFSGYRRHRALRLERAWSWLPGPARQGLAAMAAHIPAERPALRRLRKGLQYADHDGDARIASYFFWLDPEPVNRLMAPDLREATAPSQLVSPLAERLADLPPTSSALDRMLCLEQTFFLADHNLNYTDKMAMAHGVEVRVPLLDPDLVAFAARLPDDMKQRSREGKWIFKKAMEGILPDDVIYRPKTGFGAPLRRWLRHELRPMVTDVLSATSIERRGLFDAKAVARLVEDDRAGRVDGAYTIFALICMELWCRQFLDAHTTTAEREPAYDH